MQEAAKADKSRGNLVLLGARNGIIRVDDPEYEYILSTLTDTHGQFGWDSPKKLGPLLREWMLKTPGSRDYDGSIVINPYNNFRLEAVGGYVNRTNSDSVKKAICEARKIKGDRVMGKHTAAACYSTKNGNSAIVGSENGNSVITFARGEVVPDCTIHNLEGSGFCAYKREENRTLYRRSSIFYFVPNVPRLASLHK